MLQELNSTSRNFRPNAGSPVVKVLSKNFEVLTKSKNTV